MKPSIFLIFAVYGMLYIATAEVKFGQLCSGNSGNRKRGCDKHGCGSYGVSRDGGSRKHDGVDIMCADGATVYAPFDVTLKRKSVPYTENNAINDGIQLSGNDLCFKLFYVKPVKYSGTLKKGRSLGQCCQCSLFIQE